MPTYQYACTACGERLEAVQSFTDAPLTECRECRGALRKVFSAVGVVFKGSGFYKNDSRDSVQKGASSKDGGKDGGGKDGGKDGGKEATKEGASAGAASQGSSSSAASSSSSGSSGGPDAGSGAGSGGGSRKSVSPQPSTAAPAKTSTPAS